MESEDDFAIPALNGMDHTKLLTDALLMQLHTSVHIFMTIVAGSGKDGFASFMKILQDLYDAHDQDDPKKLQMVKAVLHDWFVLHEKRLLKEICSES